MGLRAIVLAIGCLSASIASTAAPTPARLDHAKKLLAEGILFDGHNDLPWAIRTDKVAPGDVAAYDLRKPTRGQTDFPRLRQGGLSAQFWSVYVPG
jgi:membrane dipeptidase